MTDRAWLFYTFYTLVFLGCLLWSGQRLLYAHKNKGKLVETDKTWPQPYYQLLNKFEFVAGLAGLILVGTRLAVIPTRSGQMWPLLMVGLVLSGPVIMYWVRRPANPFDHVWQLLALREVGPPLPRPWQFVLLLLHLIGLSVWVYAAGLALWWAAVLWSTLLATQLLLGIFIVHQRPEAPASRRLDIYVAPLTPLFLAYASGGLYLLFDLPRYPFFLPLYPSLTELWRLPFYFQSMSVAAILYTLLVELFWLNRSVKRFTVYILSCGLIVGSLTWMTLELSIHRTHGVTGTDSYGYTQMAVDLGTRGTILHRFDIFPHIVDFSIAWAPVIALGYHLPLNVMGDTASVWPPGMSILLAGGYRLLGEPGLYLTSPVLAVLTALVVGWLTVEISQVISLRENKRGSFDNAPRAEKKQRRFNASDLSAFVGGSLALFVWATSYEVIDRSLVPLADISAALFTTLVWIALLKIRASKPAEPQKPLRTYALWALIAGVTLGLAFDMRYTQLMLITSVGIGLSWLREVSRRRRIYLILVAGIGALIAALPDIIYRWQVFDSPLANPQARELTYFAPANIFPTLSRMLSQLFMEPEFGLLAPFLIAGLLWHWQRDRYGFITLAAGALAVLVLQLPYQSLRLRDLLPLFPLFIAWTSLGLVWTWRSLINIPLQMRTMPSRLINILIISIIFLSLLLPTVRAEPLVTRAWQPHRASFGYVTARERAALDQLMILTPNPAAIGAHLNGGAIALHSQRWPFYPPNWTEAEFEVFLTRMAAKHIPVFLLDDGPLVRPTIARLAAAGRLRSIIRLDVPLVDNSSSGQLYEVLGKDK